MFPSPHPGIINFFCSGSSDRIYGGMVSVPSSGDYQFLRKEIKSCGSVCKVSVPSSGDYQFLHSKLSHGFKYHYVSVPSSGDYQFLLVAASATAAAEQFPSPHPGIINFFAEACSIFDLYTGFRPLIRGLSISSLGFVIETFCGYVSVPSSGDYQFLHVIIY